MPTSTASASCAKLGVEPAKGDYKAKNILAEVITPDRKEWHPVEQEAQAEGCTTCSAGNVTPDRQSQRGRNDEGASQVKLRAPVADGDRGRLAARATAVAIEKARAVVTGGAVPPNTPVGRLATSNGAGSSPP